MFSEHTRHELVWQIGSAILLRDKAFFIIVQAKICEMLLDPFVRVEMDRTAVDQAAEIEMAGMAFQPVKDESF